MKDTNKNFVPHYVPVFCDEDWNSPVCMECGAVDCDKAQGNDYNCTSGFAPGMRKICGRCGRMECPSLKVKRWKSIIVLSDGNELEDVHWSQEQAEDACRVLRSGNGHIFPISTRIEPIF